MLKQATSKEWAPLAASKMDEVLIDHAHCEKKAAASAISLISSYPGDVELVNRCAKLAQEEMRHFQDVHRLICERGLVLTRDHGDIYVKTLRLQIRSGAEERRLDRLLVAALIEARSAERLMLLGEALTEEPLKKFYTSLARAERHHARIFVDLAERFVGCETLNSRLEQLSLYEGALIGGLPLEPRIH